jgi:hypothetical protein
MATILPTAGANWRRTANSETGDDIEFFEFNEVNSRKMSVTPGTWVVQGRSGETIDGVPNLHRLRDGDFVCRQTNDANDQWVLSPALFKIAYTTK